MVGVGRRGRKIKPLVKGACFVVLGMDDERVDAGDLGGLQGAQHGVLQKARAQLLAVTFSADRKADQQHERNGMAREALGQAWRPIVVIRLADGETVEADDRIVLQRHIAGRSSGLLALQSVARQETVQGILAAVETVNRVIAPQLFDTQPGPDAGRHSASDGSKTLGSRRSAARRGSGRGGASSAAWNAAHWTASSPKRRRSGKVSSARAIALSSTNSLTDRALADAAACSTCFAAGVRRKSSFSVRGAVLAMVTSFQGQATTNARQCHDKPARRSIVQRPTSNR